MKKIVSAIFLLAIVISVCSCRSRHGTCAAYAQAPVKQMAKHI
jgi:PBP1b-binding outer membrane lipoprotein LpoB